MLTEKIKITFLIRYILNKFPILLVIENVSKHGSVCSTKSQQALYWDLKFN